MTKKQECDELHRAIWQIVNDLRGSVDGWDLNCMCFNSIKFDGIKKLFTYGEFASINR
jgi:hypothetical protein